MKYIRLKVILLVTLIAMLIFVSISLWKHNNRQDELFRSQSTIEGLLKEIIYQDEVLSMSARMAALTGDLKWLQRHQAHNKQFEENLNELTDSGIGIEVWLQEIRLAHQGLLGFHQQAFTAVRAKNLKEAQAVLFSIEYQQSTKEFSTLSHKFDHQSLQLAHQFVGVGSEQEIYFTSENITLYILLSIFLSGGFYYIYSKIPSSKYLDTEDGEHISSQRIRYMGMTFLSFLIVFVVTVSIVMVEVNRQRELEQLQTSLETVLNTTQEALVVWLESKKQFLYEFANNRNLTLLVQPLLQVPRDTASLQQSKAQKKLREHFHSHKSGFGEVGFFLISPDAISVGSMRDQNLGTKNLVAKRRPDLLQRAFAGETVFVPPIQSDVKIGMVVSKSIPTMFVIAPVWNIRKDKVVAVLAQRLRPEEQFTRMLQLGRVGKSGESYAFDQNAVLLTNSRFDQKLRELGLVEPGEMGILNIQIRDPSNPQVDPATLKEIYPLTTMAASALQGNTSADLIGYNDYRGIPVFGAWTWIQELGIGMTTEIDVQEGMQAFRAIQYTLYSLVGGLLLITVVGVFMLLFLSERSSKALTKINEGLEERVIRRTTALNIAVEEAQAAAQAKSDFLANMSHEIRTPMNAVLGFLAIALENPRLETELRKHLSTAHNSAKNLLVIINDILDISKLEAGKVEIEQHCFNLKNTLHEAIHTLGQTLEQQGLYMTIEYEDSIPQCIQGDSNRLRQVVMNILGNAIKFTEAGGVTLKVGWQDDSKNNLHLQVVDTGIGMTKEQVEKVFEAFTQADGSTARRFGGTGLGTTISRQLIEAMGGRIWATSILGEGSNFQFTLPFDASTLTCSQDCEVFAEVVVERVTHSPRAFYVLLAEDIAENATLVELRLSQQGHKMEWAKNGTEAVEMFQNHEFDLVLMDVQMPQLDGMEATKRIRAMEKEGEHIPIIALTASVLENDRKFCFAAGMDEIVGKPIDVDELINAMEMAVPLGQGTPREIPMDTPIDTPEDAPMDESSLQVAGTDTSIQQRLAALADIPKAMLAWGEMDVYLQAVTSFMEERKDNAKLILERLQAGDVLAAKVIAHTIKGVLGNFQLQRAFRLAQKVDDLLRQGDVDAATLLIPELDDALQEAYQAVAHHHLWEEAPPAAEVTEPVDTALLRTLIQQLQAALEEDNPEIATPVLDRIAKMLGKAAVAAIAKAIASFDFEQAKQEALHLAEKYQ